jgi:hypothetical protein
MYMSYSIGSNFGVSGYICTGHLLSQFNEQNRQLSTIIYIVSRTSQTNNLHIKFIHYLLMV